MDDNDMRNILYVVCRFLLSSVIAGGRGSISLYFRLAEAALSFSASPVADIDQDEEARGRLSIQYPWGREPLPRRLRPHE